MRPAVSVRRSGVTAGVDRSLIGCLAAAILSVVGCGVGGDRRVATTASANLRIAAVGDILLDRRVGAAIAADGPDYPFERVAPVLRDADLALGNLECPITDSDARAPKPFSFRVRPAAARGLIPSGLDILGLANNHTLDCGRSGLADTMSWIDRARLSYCGAGASARRAGTGREIRVGGHRVRFLSFCDVIQDASFPTAGSPTIAQLPAEEVRRAIQTARRRSDLVVASFHWGAEYANYPTTRQRELARLAARAGADLILGHHPHVLQGFEWLRGPDGRRVLAAYSLGNFVFDPRRPPADETGILEAALGSSGVAHARLLPCLIRRCRPEPATGRAAARILARVADLSRRLGSGVGQDGVLSVSAPNGP